MQNLNIPHQHILHHMAKLNMQQKKKVSTANGKGQMSGQRGAANKAPPFIEWKPTLYLQ